MTTEKSDVSSIVAAPALSATAAADDAGLMETLVHSEICVLSLSQPHLPEMQSDDINHAARSKPAAFAEVTSVSEVARRLNDRMADLARELLGEHNAAHSSQSQLRFGTKGSLAIEVDGPKCGRWYDHENGVGGDALELLMREKQLDIGDALDWGRAWLGLRRQGVKGAAPTSNSAPAAIQQEGYSTAVDDESKKRRKRIRDVLASCADIEGTPAQLYLRGRGIDDAPADAFRFRKQAFGQYDALVALAKDANGEVLAVQQVYLTADGQKAPLAVVKRTYKAVDQWSEKAAVRLPGISPIVLCEGPETALSVWQATGREVWSCLGISNMSRAPLPENSAVTIARDGDDPDSKADAQIKKVVSRLMSLGHFVYVATPPTGEDFNDVLLKQGAEAVRDLIDQARLVNDTEPRGIYLSLGSDVEIANRVRDDLLTQFGEILNSEGKFWRYSGTHWEPIPEHELRRAVHKYDGALFPSGFSFAQVKLSKGRIDSVLNEYAALCADSNYFGEGPTGINCMSGFIQFSADGSPTVETHAPEHRCRHTLPGHWVPGTSGRPPEGSLLNRLLEGIFRGDDDAEPKTALLCEIAGSAALGYATKLKQPRAAILFGQTAENGKSQILDLVRRQLPQNAVCSVPAARMGDERHIIGLVGKLLNATDELSAGAIASDTFKSVVTGEPVEGRDVYKSRVEFRPIAQNLFATNNLPPFQGGMDRGVQRRLLVIPFNRTIPIEERIENLGLRIADEEPDLLLAWAVEGAARLIRQRNFIIPDSCKRALSDWIFGADPVLGWLNECVEVAATDTVPPIATRAAYQEFYTWAIAEGYRKDTLPAINGFVQRVNGNKAGIVYHRTGTGRFFQGLIITQRVALPF
jgi:P4 family phage/plasmid primase-like protien